MRRAFGFFVTTIAALSAHAETYKPPDFLAVTPPLPPSATGEVWRLDLAEALRIAVKQNLDVALERRSVEIARLGVEVALGGYEPTLTAGYRHSDAQTPPQSAQQGMPGEIITDVNDGWSLGISKRFMTGTRLDIGFDNDRVKSTGGTAVEPVNYRSTATLSITQPLLRGFSPDLAVPRIDVLRARIASDQQRQQLAIAMTTLVDRAEAAYWDVLQTLYRYDLAVRTAKSAEDQMGLTQRQINAGTLPPSDLISAESTLAQRRLELVQADQAVHAAWDRLRQVLNLPRAEWSRPILPTDVPRFTSGAVSADDALALALANRPELAQAGLELEDAHLAIRKADNDRLPQIDLGLVGTTVGQDNTYHDALGQLGTIDARAWAVSLNLIWTPLNRTAGAAAAINRVQRDQVALRRDQLVQTVWFEVREAVRDQLGAERQLLAAAKFRELAEKNLEIEQRKFLNGTSHSLFIQQRQEAVASARLAEIDALLAHNRAAAGVHRATGRLLAERHIELGK